MDAAWGLQQRLFETCPGGGVTVQVSMTLTSAGAQTCLCLQLSRCGTPIKHVVALKKFTLPLPLAPRAQAIPLVIKVLAKSMDTSLSPDKVELATLTRDASGKVRGAPGGNVQLMRALAVMCWGWVSARMPLRGARVGGRWDRSQEL